MGGAREKVKGSSSTWGNVCQKPVLAKSKGEVVFEGKKNRTLDSTQWSEMSSG